MNVIRASFICFISAGPSKPKEDPMGWNNGPSGGGGGSSSQWGGGGGGGGVGEPRPRDGGNGGGAGWGPPPANKPSQGSSWGQNPHGPQQPPRGPQWENDSPTMGRRFDDGTSIWGLKGHGGGLAGPPGGEYLLLFLSSLAADNINLNGLIFNRNFIAHSFSAILSPFMFNFFNFSMLSLDGTSIHQFS